MRLFRKPRAAPVAATGVGAVLTASHRPPHSVGPIHEHTWKIEVWFRGYSGDATFPQGILNEFVARYEGQILPDAFSRGEDLAKAVHERMTDDWYGHRPTHVIVSRDAEMLYARYPA